MKKLLISVLVVILSLFSFATIASCSQPTYTITYYINGEVKEGVPSTYKKSETATKLWEPTAPEGQTFDGWYTRSSLNGVKVKEITAFSGRDMEFYGRFVKDSYSITYYIDEELVENATVNDYAPSGVSKALWFPSEIESGYSFDGWYEDLNYSTSKVFFIPANVAEDKTYYGRIVEGVGDDYTISFNIDGEEVDAGIFGKYSYSATATTLWTPQIDMTKCFFDGWYDNENFTGTSISQLPAEASGDKQFFARILEPEGYGDDKTPAPLFTATHRDGSTKTLKSLYGKSPVMLNFWSTGCEPCRTEMPHIQDAYNEFSSKIEFMLIATLTLGDDPSKIDLFLDKQDANDPNDIQYTLPCYLDNGQVISKLYIPSGAGIPVTVFVDRWGYIVGDKILGGPVPLETFRARLQQAIDVAPDYRV